MAAEALDLRELGLGPAARLAQVEQRQGLCGTLPPSHMPCLRGRGSTSIGLPSTSTPRHRTRNSAPRIARRGQKCTQGKYFTRFSLSVNRECCFALPCVSACLYI